MKQVVKRLQAVFKKGGLKHFLQALWMDYRVQGRFCGGFRKSSSEGRGHKDFISTHPAMLAYIFSHPKLHLTAQDTVVDVGCGKGRVINYLLLRKFDGKIVGIEYEHDLAEETAAHLRRYPNTEIIGGDILANFPEQATVFYLFNPFGEAIMKPFIDLLLASPQATQIRVLYLNPVHENLFSERPEFATERLRIPGFRNDFLFVERA